MSPNYKAQTVINSHAINVESGEECGGESYFPWHVTAIIQSDSKNCARTMNDTRKINDIDFSGKPNPTRVFLTDPLNISNYLVNPNSRPLL